MGIDKLTSILTQTMEKLSSEDSLKGIFHQHRDGDPLPSAAALGEIISLARSIIFPGYYGKSTVNTRTIKYHIGVNIERLHKLLAEQIMAGLCFADNEDATVLGRVTIGKGCVVGANVWVTKDMKPNTKKYKQEKISILDFEFNNGTGI